MPDAVFQRVIGFGDRLQVGLSPLIAWTSKSPLLRSLARTFLLRRRREVAVLARIESSFAPVGE